jgi:hypothetical protein
MEEPAHEHDCEVCIFVGADAPEPGEPETNQVDLYIHLSERGRHTAIRRFSSDGPDYASMSLDFGAERLTRYKTVFDAARARGLL